MTNQDDTTRDENQPVKPTKKDRLRPLEFIGFSAVLAVFAGLVVLMGSRDPILALIAAGIGFIGALVMSALVGLGMKPNPEDVEARKDLEGH